MRTRVNLLGLAMLFFFAVSLADEVVKLKSGKYVLLKDDGTWVYLEQTGPDKAYAIRFRVAEASALAAAARTAVDVAYSELGGLDKIPINHARLGLAAPVSYSSKYVERVEVGKGGVVRVMLTADPALGDAAKGIVTYTPVARGTLIEWHPTCNFAQQWCPLR